MKYIDWKRAKQICLEHPNSVIYAGLLEDWWHTYGLIFDKGKFVAESVWSESRWATPVLQILTEDDSETVECWAYEPQEFSVPEWWPISPEARILEKEA